MSHKLERDTNVGFGQAAEDVWRRRGTNDLSCIQRLDVAHTVDDGDELFAGLRNIISNATHTSSRDLKGRVVCQHLSS